MTDRLTQPKIEAFKRDNNWQGLIEYLSPIVELGDRRVEHISALGFAYSQLDQYDKARYCYKEWLELEPDRAVPYYCIGYTFYDNGEWTEAIEWFDQALELFPNYIVCLYRKGIAQLNMLKSIKAKETFNSAIKAYQQLNNEGLQKSQAKIFIKAVFYLGKAYYDLEQFNNALACFKKVNEEDKRNYLAPHIKKYNLAKGFYGVKNYSEAEKILHKQIKHPMTKNYVFALLSKIQADQGEYGKAIVSLEQAIKKRPDSYLFSYRAAVHQKNGQQNKAVADFHQALKRDRVGKHKTLLNLAKISMSENRLPEAIGYLHRAIDFKNKIFDADYYDARLALAECYQLSGKDEEAKKEFAIAAELEKEWN